ncbi:MAG: ABC transporter ATP-binding protein [Candidatus Methylacidiphilales bacterium]
MSGLFQWDARTRNPLEAGKPPPEHPANSPLVIHDLTVAYGKRPVVWDIDLDIPEGSLVGIIGPNGAGKSTLLRACVDMVPITSGRILIYGKPFRDIRHWVGYVPQRESVDWDFPVTALDVATMGTYRRVGWCRRVGRAERERARAALERVGLGGLADRQISQLSGGQQQRVFLARALAQEARLYLMDEPFAAVDAATEQSIVELLRTFRDEGKTCLVVHHDLATAAEYFDWVILLNMRLVAVGPTSQILTVENLKKTYGGKLTVLARVAEEAIRVG